MCMYVCIYIYIYIHIYIYIIVWRARVRGTVLSVDSAIAAVSQFAVSLVPQFVTSQHQKVAFY